MTKEAYLSLPVEELSESLLLDSGHVIESAELLAELHYMGIFTKGDLIELQLRNTKPMVIKNGLTIPISIDVDISNMGLSDEGNDVLGDCIFGIKHRASEFIANAIRECLWDFYESKETRPDIEALWQNYEKTFLMEEEG